MKQSVLDMLRRLRRYSVAIVGFALFCAILRLPYFGGMIPLQLTDVHSIRGVLDGGILVLAAIVLAMGLRPQRDEAAQAAVGAASHSAGSAIPLSTGDASSRSAGSATLQAEGHAFSKAADSAVTQIGSAASRSAGNATSRPTQGAASHSADSATLQTAGEAAPHSAGRKASQSANATIAIVGGVFFVAGVCALSGARLLEAAPSWMASAGVVACACGFVLLCLLWVRVLVRVTYEDLLPLVLLAFTVSMFIGVIDLVEGPLKALFNILIPAGSVLCAMASLKGSAAVGISSAVADVAAGGAKKAGRKLDDASAAPVGSAVEQGGAAKAKGVNSAAAGASSADTTASADNTASAVGATPATGSSHIMLLVVLSIVFEILCCSLIRGTWSQGGVGYSNMASLKVVSYLVSAGLGIAFFCVAVYAKQPDRGSSIISIASLVVTILLIITVVLFGKTFFGSCVTSLYSVLFVVMFSVLCSAAQSRFISSNAAAGVFALVFAVSSLVQYTLIPYLYLYDSGNSASIMLPVALAAALVVAIGVCVVIALRLNAQVKALKSALGDATGDEVWEGVALYSVAAPSPVYISPDEALDLSVRKAAERYRLTEREAEIVKLFAQGRTIKQAAAELYLAPSTVQGYTKSIYAKLGVHGKDEIRGLLESL